MSKVSAERVAELVKLLEIPEHITQADYPIAYIPKSGNIMFAISAGSKAWRKVDAGVANRLFSVISSNCQSEHEVDALLDAITL